MSIMDYVIVKMINIMIHGIIGMTMDNYMKNGILHGKYYEWDKNGNLIGISTY